MTTSISLQNTIFIISTIVIISTAAIISTTLMLIMIEKEHKRFLNISFDFESSKDLITFINHTFRRNKFKRLKHSLSTSQNKFKHFYNFTFIIFSNIF